MKMESLHTGRIILIILGIIVVLWFMLPVPVTGTVNIGTVTGLGIGALLLIYGIWQPSINRLIARLWHTVGGRIAEICILAIAAVILGLAIACSAAMISGVSGEAKSGSTVIVLGARVYGDRVSRALKGRLDAAIEYLNDNPDSPCIVSGGQGKNEIVSEASVMYRYLTENGIAKDRIYMEDASTDTLENLKYSRKILEEQKLPEEVALATNDYHAYRAKQYARREGLTAEVIPAPTIWWLWPTSIVREMYGILEQWFLNR